MTNINRNLWILIVLIVFGIVYLISGTFVYTDGDAAMSIAYHVMGRNQLIQPPYSPYHGMMDKVLSILPAREELVRITAFTATKCANILMIILMLALAFDWLRANNKEYSPARYILATSIVILAVPELFYFGLVYAPTFVAMCFVLFAHLLLRWVWQKSETADQLRFLWYVFSIILFGFGVAFRWNTATYVIVIVADLLFMTNSSSPLPKRLWPAITWGVLALTSSFLMINLSGYGVDDFIEKIDTVVYVFNQSGTLSPGSDASLAEILMRITLNLTPLFTPVFASLVFIGFVKLVKERNDLLFVVIAAILSILPFLKTGVPKFIITSIPVLIFLFMVGLDFAMAYANKNQKTTLIYSILLLMLFFPWVIGVRVARAGTAWGPGFELKPFNYQEIEETTVDLVLGPGMAFPTPEGERPLYGHAYVLLREWKSFAEEAAAERQLHIYTALDLEVPLVVTKWSPDYYLVNLYSMGFHTTDAYDRTIGNGLFTERRYINGQGREIIVLYAELERNDVSYLVEIFQQLSNYKKLVLVGYPRTMRDLYDTYPNALQVLGKMSAVVELDALPAK